MSLRIQAYALAYTDMYSLAHRLYPCCGFTSTHPSQSQQSSTHTPQPCHLLSLSHPHPSSSLALTLLLAYASPSLTPCRCRCLLTHPSVRLGSSGTPNFSHASGKRPLSIQGVRIWSNLSPETGNDPSDEPHQVGCTQGVIDFFFALITMFTQFWEPVR